MTFEEITAVITGHRRQMQWQGVQTAMVVSCWSKDGVSAKKLFPGLFDDLPQPEQKQPWQIMQERVLAHRYDYKRNQGEKH